MVLHVQSSTNCGLGCFKNKAKFFFCTNSHFLSGLTTAQVVDPLPVYRDFPAWKLKAYSFVRYVWTRASLQTYSKKVGNNQIYFFIIENCQITVKLLSLSDMLFYSLFWGAVVAERSSELTIIA
jgi:hypothetical protein